MIAKKKLSYEKPLVETVFIYLEQVVYQSVTPEKL